MVFNIDDYRADDDKFWILKRFKVIKSGCQSYDEYYRMKVQQRKEDLMKKSAGNLADYTAKMLGDYSNKLEIDNE